MDFDLADLRVFATAATAGSLSAAARELHLTQPSISERLRRLERVVGQPLFVRSSGGVSLAPAGARLLPYAERCLALAGCALDIARAEDTSGTVHVTTHASYAPLAVPFVLAALRPLKYSVIVDDQHSEDAVHRVAAGSTDMAFTLPVAHATKYGFRSSARSRSSPCATPITLSPAAGATSAGSAPTTSPPISGEPGLRRSGNGFLALFTSRDGDCTRVWEAPVSTVG